MVDARLIIDSPVSGQDTTIGTISGIPISITLAIADIREPDKRNSTFSKTITIPGSKDANILFENIFNVVVDLNSFNPNLKVPCRYVVKGEKVFSGDIQLLKIRKRGISPEIEIFYECSIVGRLSQAFLDLGNALLTDLDFSDLNHTFNYSNRNWTPTLGTGYVYNLADYGVNGGNTTIWDFAHLKPAIFEKEYIDRIFDSIGKTFTSTYFNSTYGTSIIIPDNNEGALKMTASQINALSFYAGKTAITTGNIPLSYSSFWGGWIQATNPYPLALGVFNDDSTTPFYDGGNNYTFSYTSPIAMNFTGKTRCNFEMQVNEPDPTTNNMVIQGGAYNVIVTIVVQGIGTATSTAQVVPNFTGWTAFTVNVDLPGTQIPANTNIYVSVDVSGTNFMNTTFLNSGTPITVGTASIDLRLLVTDSWFSGTSADGNLPIGYTVNMNQTVPKNIKQIDFLMSVIKSENLYMELDLTDPLNYIIERRPDFYLANSQAEDWTSKWDYQKETEIIPIGELDFRKYLFTYKKDGDKYNKLYFDSYGEVYGQEQINVANDFIKNEKKTELIFAATPMVGNSFNSLVYPVFAQTNGNILKPMATTIRRLYWGGTVQLLSGFYGMVNAVNGSMPTNLAIYPFAGTVDNPYAPTLSIDWGVPKILYYNYPGQTWTTNNLYLRGYKAFIEQITDENSKIVVMWMYLTASDIANFTFRKPIWVHDSYYLVNKIYDYNPEETSITKVEFLRLTHVNDPVAEDIIIWQNGEGEDSSFQYGIILSQPESEPNGNVSNSDGISLGQDNVNQGVQSGILGGSGNYIGGIQ